MTRSIPAPLLMLALLGATLCPPLAAETFQLTPRQSEAMGVHFIAPQSVEMARGPAWPGVVALPPDGHELLVAPLPGRVIRLHASAGERVRANQPLLTLHSPALAQLAQDHRKAVASVDLAHQTLHREQRLVREGIGAERRAHEAEIQLRQARSELDGLRVRLRLAGITPEKRTNDQLASAELILKAPRDGDLLALDATPGAWLEAGAPAMEMGYTARRWIEAELPLEQASRMQTGQTAWLAASDATGEIKASLLSIGLRADMHRQTVLVRLSVDEGAALRPGQRVSVRFATAEAIWRLPASAVVQLDGVDSIFVQRGDALLPLTVHARGQDAGDRLVEAALRPGDRVVSQGAIALKAAWLARESVGTPQ
ncbi:MAG: efflux RND transporter periplasmic adaptor subunit [Pseudomonadota bacterium]